MRPANWPPPSIRSPSSHTSPAQTTEAALSSARPARDTMQTVPARLAGWGNGPAAWSSLAAPHRVDEVVAALELGRARGHGALARGMGRSYGDAAQLDRGLVIDMRGCKRFELDPARGTVTAEAGVTLGELLGALMPQGWVIPVLPGTQHVTVGGAIAGDIHGKSHGTAGTFGRWVQEIELLSSQGDGVTLAPGRPERLFEATIGGMGLTGVILRARLELRAIEGPWLTVDTDRVRSLDDALCALRAPGGVHRVAWLDLLGPSLARGVVTRAEYAAGEQGRASGEHGRARGLATVPARATVPPGWPGGLLRPSTVRVFNELRFRSAPARARGHLEGLASHMFPLDGLNAWPRLYGPTGFLQYQLVVPTGQEDALTQVISRLRSSGAPCYLAVLKDFGPENDAPLSFPLAGWTLTLDIPLAADGLEPLLRSFDDLVIAAGGRVYLSKDVRLGPDALRAMYPRLPEWLAIRDRADPERLWRSDLSTRLELT